MTNIESISNWEVPLLAGCPYGKYGDTCHLNCPDKCLGPCDLDTGICLFGCFDGWIGDRCDAGKRFVISIDV